MLPINISTSSLRYRKSDCEGIWGNLSLSAKRHLKFMSNFLSHKNKHLEGSGAAESQLTTKHPRSTSLKLILFHFIITVCKSWQLPGQAQLSKMGLECPWRSLKLNVVLSRWFNSINILKYGSDSSFIEQLLHPIYCPPSKNWIRLLRKITKHLFSINCRIWVINYYCWAISAGVMLQSRILWIRGLFKSLTTGMSNYKDDDCLSKHH